MYANTCSGGEEDVCQCNLKVMKLIGNRCFLYLQNYARTKPDVALRALPVLQEVSMLNLRITDSDNNRIWRTQIH